MLKNYREVICWLSSHAPAVLVITSINARVVDAHNHAAGVQSTIARALEQPQRRGWFEVEERTTAGRFSGSLGRRTIMRLNVSGLAYHAKLLARHKCVCAPLPAAKAGAQAGQQVCQ